MPGRVLEGKGEGAAPKRRWARRDLRTWRPHRPSAARGNCRPHAKKALHRNGHPQRRASRPLGSRASFALGVGSRSASALALPEKLARKRKRHNRCCAHDTRAQVRPHACRQRMRARAAACLPLARSLGVCDCTTKSGRASALFASKRCGGAVVGGFATMPLAEQQIEDTPAPVVGRSAGRMAAEGIKCMRRRSCQAPLPAPTAATSQRQERFLGSCASSRETPAAQGRCS